MRPHALLLPFPAQGHVNPFAQLAQILIHEGVQVTFVNTEHNHRLLNPVSKDGGGGAGIGIRFECFPDGLPPEHGRVQQLAELIDVLKREAPAHTERIMMKSAAHGDPVTVIISDGIFSFTNDIARRHGVPRVAFQTTSACGFSCYHYMPTLVRHGYVPLPEDKDAQREWMEKRVSCIPEMGTVRVKDLTSFCLVTDTSDFCFQHFQNEAQQIADADLILLNTWRDLEAAVLTDLAKRFSGGEVAVVGPLSLSLSRICNGAAPFETSLWAEDRRCLDWLDGRREAAGSVLYVSFGSITVMTESELAEFAWGLAATGRPFLWVLRPDAVRGQTAAVTETLPAELVEATRDRGFFVAWAPQRKVVQHPAVGGFLTHSGWNSTLDSLCAGVPMLCWPFFAEQQTNRRFVSSVWRVGFEMDEEVRRDRVAAMVDKLMDPNDADGAAVRANAKKMRERALAATAAGGSSDAGLQRLLNLVFSSSSSLRSGLLP